MAKIGIKMPGGGGPSTDEKAKVSSNDTTAGYLNGKLVAGTNITLTENNDGGDETLTIDANVPAPYTDENAQDAVGSILTDSSEIDFTYNDGVPSITASIVAGSIDETKLDASTNASLDLADTAIQSADLAPYELLDGSNQPATGDKTISKTAPKHSLVDGSFQQYVQKTASTGIGKLVSTHTDFPATYAIRGAGAATGTCTNLSIGNSCSISLWIKNTISGTWASGTSGGSFYISATSTTQVAIFCPVALQKTWTVPNMNDGNWHHLVFVRNGDTVKLYFDNVDKGNTTGNGTTAGSISMFLNFSATAYLIGTLEEFVVYNYQLNATEVNTLYNSGAGVYTTDFTNVIMAYHFDNGSGTTVSDSIPAGTRNITLGGSGSTWEAGLMGTGSTTSDRTIHQTLNGSSALEMYVSKFGDYSGVLGTSHVWEGLKYTKNLLGSEKHYFDSTRLVYGIVGSTRQASTTVYGFSNSITDNNFGGANIFGNSNTDNRGHSVLIGVSNTASTGNGTERAVALGFSNSVGGHRSLACGVSNTASVQNCIAVGYANTASGSSSVAIGNNCQAAANQIAIGLSATASGSGFLSIGTSTSSTGSGGIAIGQSITAAGSNSINIGTANSNCNNNSFLFGTNITTTSGNTSKMVLGQSTTLSGGGGTTAVGFSNNSYRTSSTSRVQMFGYGNAVVGDSSAAYGRSLVSYLPNVGHYGIGSTYYTMDNTNNRYAIHQEATVTGFAVNRDTIIMDSASLGSELGLNTDFSSGPFTSWDVGANWTWSAGNSRAEHTGASDTALKQTQFLTQGAVYELTLNTMTYSTGATFYFTCAGFTLPTIQFDLTSSTSTLVFRFVAANGGGLSFSGSGLELHATGTFTIDSVSLKQVTGGKLTVLKELYVGNDTDSQDHKLTNTGNVLNENGLDLDTRIEGDTDQNLLMVDASADKVGIGTATPNSKLDVAGSFQCDSITNDTGLAHGTYTPTLTGVANVTSSTARLATYLRVGNSVTVAGQIDVEPTANNTQTKIGISLPISSNFSTAYQAGGIGHSTDCSTAVIQHGAAIYADATNDRVEMIYFETKGTADTFTYTFTYQVI